MKVLIIGANGRTGRHVTKMLGQTQHQPVAMIRDTAQRTFFDGIGVPTVLGDLEYPIDPVFQAFGGFDAAVFTAGSVRETPSTKPS